MVPAPCSGANAVLRIFELCSDESGKSGESCESQSQSQESESESRVSPCEAQHAQQSYTARLC